VSEDVSAKVSYTTKELLEKVDRNVDDVRQTVVRIEERMTAGHDDHERRISAHEFRIAAVEKAEKARDSKVESLTNKIVGAAITVAIALLGFSLTILSATGKF
jgi:hypothetical protein